jgi:hypothetical protein
MGIGDLTVDHRKVPLGKLLSRSRHYFGRICHALKHRLAEKCCAQTNTVNPTRQFVCLPRFYGMGNPRFMQRAVRVDHLFGDQVPFPTAIRVSAQARMTCGKAVSKVTAKRPFRECPNCENMKLRGSTRQRRGLHRNRIPLLPGKIPRR